MSAITCEQSRGKLDAFADRELAARESAFIAEHLAGCPKCGSDMEALTAWKNRTREAARGQVTPLGLETRIRASIQQTEQRAKWWRPPLSQTAVAGAAVVALTLGMWVAVLRPMQARIAGILAIGTADHIHCTLERKQPAPGTLNRPLPGHHDEIVPVAQRALPAGFELIESHNCRFQDRVFTHIVFGRGENRLSVIVTKKRDGEHLPGTALPTRMKASGIPVYSGEKLGLQTLGMETPASWGFVVSDLEARTNEALMAAVAAVIVRADRQ